MKKSNDTIGNRTRDLPACSVVPQPTALPRAPSTEIKRLKTGANHCPLRTLPKARLVNLRVQFSKRERTNELVTTAKIYSIERNKDVGRRRGLHQGSLLHIGIIK